MYEQYLVESNPHWREEKLNTGTKRHLLYETIPLLDVDHIIAITGIRRCGKSYFLRQIADYLLEQGVRPEQILFLNFEMPAFVGQKAYKVLDELFETYKKLKNPKGRLYLFFDEVQMLPEWETWIKYNYDLLKGKIKFFITGSNSHLLSSEFSTLLTGRIIQKALYPFSFSEVLTHRNIKWRNIEDQIINKVQIIRSFEDYLVNGGMPEILEIGNPELKREFLISYFNAIIYKDIIPRFSIREASLLNELAINLLSNTSNLININRTAKYYNANRKTIREFIRFLQMAFFIFMVPKFHFSIKTRELSLKKCYAADNGFVHYLPLQFSPNSGKLLENLVFLELKKRFEHVFYWRNSSECDFVAIDKSGQKNIFQVCYNLTPDNREREIKGLISVVSKYPESKGIILTFNDKDEIEEAGKKITVKPVYEWLIENSNVNKFYE